MLIPHWYGVVTLFPDMFNALQAGIIGRAMETDCVRVCITDLRAHSYDKHRRIDARPYGGGVGMVLKFAPLWRAKQSLLAKSPNPSRTRTIYLSPQGTPITQAKLTDLVKNKTPLIFICGRYEGIDERFLQTEVSEEWSIGDIVVSGGEMPAMLCLEALIRHIPGVLAKEAAILEESFSPHTLFDYPSYTKPKTINGLSVPKVLFSGNHAQIAAWRKQEAEKKALRVRPDLATHLQK